MRKYYITLSALLAFISFYAQNNTDTSYEKLIMKQALRYGDENVAVSQLYSIIAKEGANSVYKDSLAYLYFNARKYSSCFMVCSDILSGNDNKLDILEMQAVALESLGAADKSAQVYAKLVTKTKNNFHAYKLANLYYVLKKYEMAYMAIKKAQELKDTGKIKVNYAVNKNYTQQASLLAAIANLKGMIEFAQKKNELAKKSFSRAIELQPDFVMAKDNLRAVNEDKLIKKE
jgi:tetratricopeptide (TPR) repeat protein